MSEDLSEFVTGSAGEATVKCDGFDYTTGTGWSQDSGANLHQRGLLVSCPPRMALCIRGCPSTIPMTSEAL